MIKFKQLSMKSLEMINGVAKHKATLKYLKLSEQYYGHSLRMFQGRAHQLLHTHRQLKHRIYHGVGKVTRLMNPFRWIPPFESK